MYLLPFLMLGTALLPAFPVAKPIAELPLPSAIAPVVLLPEDRDSARRSGETADTGSPSANASPSAAAVIAASGDPGSLDGAASTTLARRAGPANSQIQARYPWRQLFLQSLAFHGVENAYRFATDPYLRHLAADAPFWHNYAASLKQFNMRRWNDGDDFLVNYVGHPMQGGVTSFIEIQNNPRDRNLRIGLDRAYWRSRFVGMMWATAYSTYSEIGPTGEAGIGNEGGYTYALNCPYFCTKPGVKYTNNTGWVDFIITPTVGTVWVLAEDLVDRFVSDPLHDRYRALGNIVRGSLNPTRTMANAMRGRLPWYRDYMHEEDAVTRPFARFEREDDGAPPEPRLEIFPHFTALSMVVNRSTNCFPCRHSLAAPSFGISYRLAKHLDFDSDFTYLSNASQASSALRGGNATLAVFGLRTGIETPRFSLKVAVRPGFLSYDRVYLPNRDKTEVTTQTGRATHFAASLLISADYTLARHLALRTAIGNTPVRYGAPTYSRAPNQPPYFYFIAKQPFTTNENWVYSAGPVFRF